MSWVDGQENKKTRGLKCEPDTKVGKNLKSELAYLSEKWVLLVRQVWDYPAQGIMKKTPPFKS